MLIDMCRALSLFLTQRIFILMKVFEKKYRGKQ